MAGAFLYLLWEGGSYAELGMKTDLTRCHSVLFHVGLPTAFVYAQAVG